jgi:UDP-N-acetylmuramoyl-L-alanyl-D-glutamate--2,6-diaminopimelate ligase
LLGTIRYDDGHSQVAAELTTPSGPVLYDWLRRMVDGGCSAVAMEVSSHALVQERVAGLELNAAVMTNIGRDHLDYHADLESYVQAKALIKERLLRGDGTGSGTLVYNGDDPLLTSIPTGSIPTIGFHAQTGSGSAGASALQLTAAKLGLDGTHL